MSVDSRAFAEMVVERMKEMSEEDREEFLGVLKGTFCLDCASETGGDTCWSCYSSPLE